VRAAKEGQQCAEQEAHALQAQINQQNRQNQGANANNGEADETNVKLSRLEKKSWESKARLTGCQAGALYDPFLDTAALAGHRVQTHIDEILDDVK
jgi:hypothetical protein